MLEKERLLDIEGRFEELDRKLCDPSLQSDVAAYTRVARERASLEELAQVARRYRELLEQLEEVGAMLVDPEMGALAREEMPRLNAEREGLEERLKRLLLPRDPNADRNVLVEIRAAAGGEEAALFAGELFRMYCLYADKQSGWKYSILSDNATELGGFKEVVFEIAGHEAYSHLKFESGVHRVQRVPATESSGRIHTSTVTVAVLPEAEEVDEIPIRPDDLKVDTYRAQGAGGQHVNKTESAIRITHLPSGIVVACQDERSQHQNRDKAMRMLRTKLLEAERIKAEQELTAERRSQVGTGDRSEKIRTYNFKESRVTDHRIGLTLHNLPSVLNGDLDPVIKALQEEEQKELLAQAQR